MARSHVNHFSDFPYHITARTVNRERFHIPLDRVWHILSDQLFLAHHLDGLKIHAFVLMPNHFHLLASLSTTPLPIVMNRFMKDASKEMNLASGRSNQNWGGRHYKCEIKTFHYFMNAYKYIYQNPIRAGLCSNIESWEYSSLFGLLGYNALPFPVNEDTLLFQNNTLDLQNLSWINTPIDQKHLVYMKAALTKKEFKLSNISHYEINPLENRLI